MARLQWSIKIDVKKLVNCVSYLAKEQADQFVDWSQEIGQMCVVTSHSLFTKEHVDLLCSSTPHGSNSLIKIDHEKWFKSMCESSHPISQLGELIRL